MRRFFATPAAFRAWLSKHHETAADQWVGYYKRGSGKPGITWPESVDQALCFGWIDGLRRGIDAESYEIRFTPRKPRSIWSLNNVRRAKALIEQGAMTPAGLRAFEARKISGVYSFEQATPLELDPARARALRADAAAWAFFQQQPPWYRRVAVHWVMSAKKEETREKRFAALLDDSAHQRLVKPLRRP